MRNLSKWLNGYFYKTYCFFTKRKFIIFNLTFINYYSLSIVNSTLNLFPLRSLKLLFFLHFNTSQTFLLRFINMIKVIILIC